MSHLAGATATRRGIIQGIIQGGWGVDEAVAALVEATTTPLAGVVGAGGGTETAGSVATEAAAAAAALGG